MPSSIGEKARHFLNRKIFLGNRAFLKNNSSRMIINHYSEF